jgi:hypothetical protein
MKSGTNNTTNGLSNVFINLPQIVCLMRRGRTLLIGVLLLPVVSKYIKLKRPLSAIVCGHYIVE